jgi:hypothetical protein
MNCSIGNGELEKKLTFKIGYNFVEELELQYALPCPELCPEIEA